MTSIKFKLAIIILLTITFAIAANAQNTYWLGTRDGDQSVLKPEFPPMRSKL